MTLRSFSVRTILVVLALAAALGTIELFRLIWVAAPKLDAAHWAALIAAGATLLSATVTIMVGRYFERARELEALYRDKKIPIYSRFLQALLAQFQAPKPGEAPTIDLAQFLREWQQDIVIWGGPEVVNAYLEWKSSLQNSGATARALLSTDDLILAIRNELGNTNRGLPKGLFARLILRHPKLFMEMAAKNPDLRLEEFGQEEMRLGLESASGEQ